jgi:hypothetical protein
MTVRLFLSNYHVPRAAALSGGLDAVEATAALYLNPQGPGPKWLPQIPSVRSNLTANDLPDDLRMPINLITRARLATIFGVISLPSWRPNRAILRVNLAVCTVETCFDFYSRHQTARELVDYRYVITLFAADVRATISIRILDFAPSDCFFIRKAGLLSNQDSKELTHIHANSTSRLTP